MPTQSKQIYQIKVTLDDTYPPVWRRFQVPANTTLLKLHDILQIVMGWVDYHLHMFTIEGTIYGDPADDEYGDLGTIDESRIKLNQVIHRAGQRFSYEYDFGDSWDHTLLVEKILPPQEGVRYPICLKGKRACPPEDVGGVWGYEKFLEAIRNPDHDEHEEYLTWIGGEFAPEAFDLTDVNARLRSMGRGRSTEALSAWSQAGDEFTAKNFELASPWPETFPDEQQRIAEELPLRRDVTALLTYLRDNKVTGTQSTGNLPLKAVHEICARFVDPPQLEETIGERVFRVRSETEVWPLHFRHILAAVGGLTTGGLGRRWEVTLLGERFLAARSPLQVWLLLVTWWTQTNWAVASPFYIEDGYMPTGFSQLALKHLLELPLGEPASFEQFADRMIEDSRMVWPIENQDSTRRILRAIVERTVIDPLVDFGILQTGYEPHKTLGAEFQELSTFRITAFGRGLLKAIRGAMKPDKP
jgi:hypothetical protein